MSDEENEAIAKLEREAFHHQWYVTHLEERAREHRQKAEAARKCIEYIRKQRGS